jgi:serine/threonine protein kinase
MTPAADLYALGATLYALLAGAPPRAYDPLATSVNGDTVADLPHAPLGLMAVLRRAMALDPRDRFATARDLAAALA